MPEWDLEVNEIFVRAIEIDDPDERSRFLENACRGKSDLMVQVQRLLGARERAGSFMQRPALSTNDEATGAPDSIAKEEELPDQSASPIPAFPARRERLGTGIGPYKLLQEIGEGGMGLVYMAEQEQPIRRRVALKIIKPGMDSRQVIARFEAERQALALMDHQNIARVLGAGTTDSGKPYFVMELVYGIAITRYCDNNRLSLRRRLELFVPICHAIQHAHQKGIIHRDIKPSNVLITMYDGQPVPKVIDFGVAKAIDQRLTDKTMFTQFGMLVGTLEYMPPEQAEMSALGVDTRSDVYSLGVLLYELLTGTTPLQKDKLREAGFEEILRRIRDEVPPTPSTRVSTTATAMAIAAQRHTDPNALSRLVRGELDWIVMKCLEKDRTRRYETVNGLARDIMRYLHHEPVEACPPSAIYRWRVFATKYRTALSTAAAIAMLLLAGAGFSVWQAVRATRAESTAIAALAETEQARDAEKRQRRLAEANEQKAIAAADQERSANEQATKRLQQIQKGNEILAGIFADLDIRAVRQGNAPLEAVLAKRLVAAGKAITGEALGDPLVVAELQQVLARSLRSLGFAGDAIPLLEQSQQLFAEAAADNAHPNAIEGSNELALAYQDTGDFSKAVALLEKALVLTKSKLGETHRDTLSVMNNLALAYMQAGDLSKALPLLEQTLTIQESKLGDGNPDTITSMNNLATAYQNAGKFVKAVRLFEHTLELRKKSLGERHPDTLGSMNNLALAYQKAGKLSAALPLLEASLSLHQSILGTDHPQTLTNMHNLAMAYLESGDSSKAMSLFEETLTLMNSKLGDGHPNVLASMHGMALALQDQGESAKAIAILERTLALAKSKLGDEHPSILPFMNSLAVAYQLAGDSSHAVPLYEEVLRLARSDLGEEHLETLGAAISLGQCFIALQQFQQAEKVVRECLQVLEKDMPDSRQVYYAKSLLGEALLGLGRSDEAAILLHDGYEGLQRHADTIPQAIRTQWLTQALDRLIALAEAQGKPEKAAQWKAQRDSLLDGPPASIQEDD